MLKDILKKIISFLSLLMLLPFLNSCRSENSDTEEKQNFFVQAKFNGEKKIFGRLDSFGKSFSGEQTLTLNLNYWQSGSGAGLYPQVLIFLGAKNNGTPLISTGVFSEENANIDFELRTANSQNKASLYPETDFKYNITEFSETKIRGTFNGTLKNKEGEIINVTEGEFYGYNK